MAECDQWGSGQECSHQDQLDHFDVMLHDILQRMTVLDPLIPHLPRIMAMLDPAAAMRRTWKRGRSDAVPQRKATPLHVRPPSEDRGPVGA